jgi:hypothetical protein
LPSNDSLADVKEISAPNFTANAEAHYFFVRCFYHKETLARDFGHRFSSTSIARGFLTRRDGLIGPPWGFCVKYSQ